MTTTVMIATTNTEIPVHERQLIQLTAAQDQAWTCISNNLNVVLKAIEDTEDTKDTSVMALRLATMTAIAEVFARKALAKIEEIKKAEASDDER